MDKMDSRIWTFGQVLQIMQVEFVELYQHFGIQPPEGAAGVLRSWRLDTPDSLGKNRRGPAALILPGGGYDHVSQREAEPVALQFVAKGYAAFCLTYSCAPHRYPTALREAAMAMAYIRENADSFGIDPHMVAAMGFSAGGHLCGVLGTCYDSLEVARIGSPAMLRPDALGLCYPVAVSWGKTHAASFRNLCGEDESLAARLSLDKLVRPDMPPVFLWHTRDDATVPCRNSLVLASALDAAGVDFAFHLYRRGRHGLSTADELAYRTDDVPEVSWDVRGWVQAEMRFFTDHGFKIQDF